jgi:WD40 repeat protein
MTDIQELIDNPYVGPKTFLEGQRHLFFGRSREAGDLFSLVLSQRLVLFYAPSGAGKSSLINTRLTHDLNEEGFTILPVGRVKGELQPDISEADNIFVYNLLLSLYQDEGDAAGLAHTTLSDGLQQFRAEQIGDQGALENPCLLIIDQLEELFTTRQERWEQREGFFQQLRQAMRAEPDPLLWVLLVIREDWLASLEAFAPLLPGKLRTRFHMQKLGYNAALEAIKEPAKKGGRPFELQAAEALANNLRRIPIPGREDELHLGEFVEPVQLQVVCYQLWEKLKHRPPGTITEQDVQELGNVDKALEEFYEEAIADVIRQVGVPEIELRAWFEEELITEDRTRSVVFQGIAQTGGLPNRAVKMLGDKFLLHATARARGTWYELVHDRFIDPILKANAAWRSNVPLVRVAQAWADLGRPSSALLGGQELEDALATNWRRLGSLVREYIQASQAAAEQARREEQAARERELEAAQKLAEEAKARADAERLLKQEALERARDRGLAATRLRRRAWLLAGLGALAAILAIVVGILLVLARGNAAAERRASTSYRLAVAANDSFPMDPQLGLLLALYAASETYSEDETLIGEAENALHRAVQVPTTQLTLTLHTDGVYGIAFSPNGTRLATASADRTAIVWDAETGEEVRTLTGHTDVVYGVAFRPDGARLATASADGTAIVWDAKTGEVECTLTGHTDIVYGVAFSPDGTRLATTSADKTAKVWDAETGEVERTLWGHTNAVFSVAFSPDGTRLATASADGTAIVWNPETGARVLTLSGHTGSVRDIAFSPDGTRLATASADRTAKVWGATGATAGRELLTLTGHTVFVYGVAFSPDGKRLATCSADRTPKVWDAASGWELSILAGHARGVQDIAFSPDGARLATASVDRTARVWDATPDDLVFTSTGHTFWVNGVAFGPDGARLATASADKTAKVWNAETGDEMLTQSSHTEAVQDIAFSPDGTRLATASADRTAKVWNAESGEVVRTLTGHTDVVYGLAFSPDGTHLATASADRTAKVWKWDTISGQEVFTLTGHTDIAYDVAFSPDGKRLATASADKTAKVWDATSGRELFTLTGHTDVVYSVAFSPDGKRLATASADKTAKVWDGTSGRELFTLYGHTDAVRDIAFSPDGKRLATASMDWTAKVWDAAPGPEIMTLSGHTDTVRDVAFSPDGKGLATASTDGTVRVHVLDIEELMTLARQRVTRPLTPGECERYSLEEQCQSAPFGVIPHGAPLPGATVGRE